MNIKANLFEKCVNFVDTTKKQNKTFLKFAFLSATFKVLFVLFYLKI